MDDADADADADADDGAGDADGFASAASPGPLSSSSAAAFPALEPPAPPAVAALLLPPRLVPRARSAALGWLLALYACRLNRFGALAPSPTPAQAQQAPFSPGASGAGAGPGSSPSPAMAALPAPLPKFARLEGPLRLGRSLDVMAAKAEALLCAHDPGAALALTRQVYARDPQHQRKCPRSARGAPLTSTPTGPRAR